MLSLPVGLWSMILEHIQPLYACFVMDPASEYLKSLQVINDGL